MNSLSQFLETPGSHSSYILTIQKDEQGKECLRPVKKGIWTWFACRVLRLRHYTLPAVVHHIIQHPIAMPCTEVNHFYRLIKEKVKHYNDKRFDFFKIKERIPLELYCQTNINLPREIAGKILVLAQNPKAPEVCQGFYHANRTYGPLTLFQMLKKEEGIIGALINKVHQDFPVENEENCRLMLKKIDLELKSMAMELGGFEEIKSVYNEATPIDKYYRLAKWVENKRTVLFFKACQRQLGPNGHLLYIEHLSLDEQAKCIREFLKTDPDVAQLKKLNLEDKNLSFFVPEIECFKQLESLNLENNNITDISVLLKLVNLQDLNLSKNQIQEIPKELPQLTNLRTLFLSGNQIKEIPKELPQLTNLRTLFLNGNQIKEIPQELSQLVNLENLYLSNNQIKEIPKELPQLTNLRTLSLNGNQIKEIPQEMLQFVNLENLYFSNNQIKEIPKELSQLINLQKLNLSKNQIKEIPQQLSQIVNLKILDLFYNQIKGVPKVLSQLADRCSVHL